MRNGLLDELELAFEDAKAMQGGQGDPETIDVRLRKLELLHDEVVDLLKRAERAREILVEMSFLPGSGGR